MILKILFNFGEILFLILNSYSQIFLFFLPKFDEIYIPLEYLFPKCINEFFEFLEI